MSNADLRSMKRIHSLFSYFAMYFILISSVILSMLTSHPIPFLNPVYPSFNFHCLSLYSSCCNLSLRIVSSSLYIGDVFVIGLAL